MVSRFTRWTALCGCIFELESDPDSNNPTDKDNRFALANYICPTHESLKSTSKKPDHASKSNHVMQVLGLAKQNNIDQSQKHIARFKQGTKQHKEAAALHSQVLKFNDDITDEWNELTSNIHAFDEHIYNIVLQENRQEEP